MSLSRARFILVYGCLGVGQPSSSVVMGIEEVRERERERERERDFIP